MLVTLHTVEQSPPTEKNTSFMQRIALCIIRALVHELFVTLHRNKLFVHMDGSSMILPVIMWKPILPTNLDSGMREFGADDRVHSSQPYNYTNWYNNLENGNLENSGNSSRRLCTYYNPAHQWQLTGKCSTKRLFICKRRAQSIEGSAPINGTGSSPSISPSVTSTSSTSIRPGNPDETLKKLNEVLNSLEGAYFNHSSAETNMKELGAVLDRAVNPTGAGQTSQPLDLLSQVIKTGEKIGELMVKGLKKGGNITQPTSIQIQTGSITLGVHISPPNSTESVEFPKMTNRQTTSTCHLL
ncbi:hypothetical protein OS493_001460 [Desmophyllum pertusum]|uniref:Uncharacterized protein n=1 Tax=Desmophyllum pertusum TaxID=174260 RepID=A0A9W9ZH11_9CNID|nr:hypothetical protein OS493_001460 [Desmophyllum pertusum]